MQIIQNAIEVDISLLKKAYRLMAQVSVMAQLYDDNRKVAQYVHSTSRGHEAIQLATAFHLKPIDYVAPYYRDESILLGLGYAPYELMLQLLAKKDDPFSGGRSYYSHPAAKHKGKPVILHQSAATGMQAIPATGAAQGIKYQNLQNINFGNQQSIVLCSLGDGSVTEGEVSEAFQFAVLHRLPIIYLVQDNDWGISVTAKEARAMNAFEYAKGFKGLKAVECDGSIFEEAYDCMKKATDYVRYERSPILVRATVPLLGHHTSGVRKEWYRNEADLKKHYLDDPYPKLKNRLLALGLTQNEIAVIEATAKQEVTLAFNKAAAAAEPEPASVFNFIFAPTPVSEEKGERSPANGEKTIMVDAALHATEEIMRQHPEALFYGQDVGGRLGGVFREAATLAQKFGVERVFNTAIQEAYLVGSTKGMAATGCKPIVEIQFCDYMWPGINQLATELAKGYYLSNGQLPIQSLIRIPVGAYGGGGPYHSGTHESALLTIPGIKVVYPSNAADMKGLFKAAFLDPNPVVMLEHKGLYWSKVPGTNAAKTIEPDEHYVIPLGKARIALEANNDKVSNGETLTVITYGMGVHWALNAAEQFKGQVEIVDLRTLNPLDEAAIYQSVKKHNKCIVLTEEPLANSFAENLAGRIMSNCWTSLDAPVLTIGALNLPAVPINLALEATMLPTAEKVCRAINDLLKY